MRRLSPGLARLFATTSALGAALLPHVAHFPLWVTTAVAGAIAWRLFAEQRGWGLPPRAVRFAAAALATVAVLGSYRTLNGLDAGTALLAIMAGLKLTETRAPRDHAVLVFIGYFLCVATLLYGQTFLRLLYTLFAAWLLTAALARVHRPVEANTPVRPFRLAARTLALGAPLALVLFLFVPRIEGRFWAVPAHTTGHTTGIDDEMNPGDVAELSQSDDPAFRVWFQGPPPAPELRYFRMLVLEEFDGRAWRRASGYGDGRPAEVAPEGPTLDYRILLEPTQREWLPALDTVIDWPGAIATRSRSMQLIYFDRALLERRPVTAALDYRLKSSPGAAVMRTALPRDLAARDRALPQGRAPATRALAAQLRSGAPDDRAYIERVLDRFRHAPYAYTLAPQTLGREPVDEFLFRTREGFCEHYASAFTVLMRAAGIPARVVIGYQGGDFNTYGNYLLVRQSHAHAWSEVWLEGSGWTRVDPTAAVAPERVRRGRLGEGVTAEGADTLFGTHFAWLESVRAAWDAARTAWYEGVIGFNPDQQARILDRLGLGAAGAQGLAIALGLGFGLAALALGAWLAWELRPRRLDPVQAAWLQLGTRLGALGLARRAGEGPIDFGRRVAAAAPELGARFAPVVTAYVEVRYFPGATAAERTRFVELARRFGERLKDAAGVGRA